MRIYIKDPGGLLSPKRAQTLIPAIKAVIGDKPLELHAHCTIGLAEHTYMDAPGLRRERPAVRLRAPRPTAPRIRRPNASSPTCARWGTACSVDDEALREVSRYFTRLAEAEGLPVGRPQGFDAALSAAPAARAAWSAPCAGSWPKAGCRTWRVR